MDVREKLVELLDDIQVRGEDFTDYEIYGMRVPDTVSNEDVASHLIAHGVTVQKWTPVAERLPGKEEYTAKTEDSTEYYVRLLIAYKTDIIEYEIGYYDGYKWMTEMPIRIINDVVAWMPFPNLQQPQKEE